MVALLSRKHAISLKRDNGLVYGERARSKWRVIVWRNGKRHLIDSCKAGFDPTAAVYRLEQIYTPAPLLDCSTIKKLLRKLPAAISGCTKYNRTLIKNNALNILGRKTPVY